MDIDLPCCSRRQFLRTAAVALPSLLPAAETQDDLFDPNILHDVRLYLSPGSWQTLRDNAAFDTYYPAELHWRGLTISNIGIRSRGSGSRSPIKPGLKLDFSKYQSQTFLNLKSLILDNNTQDPSLLQERVNMRLFAKSGFPAPREAAARLFVNDDYFGLYSIVEPVDKTFLRRHYNEDSGYLYELNWQFEYRFEYLGAEPDSYCPSPFEPKTNESSPQAERFAEFAEAVNRSSHDAFPTAVSTFIDIERLLAYVAIENYISESDGFCGLWGMNNFYLYRAKTSSQFRIIPWDKDVTYYDPTESIYSRTDTNVLTDRALHHVHLRRAYLQAAQRTATLAQQNRWLEAEILREANLVRRAVEEDPVRPTSFEAFEQAIPRMANFVDRRTSLLMDQAASELDSM